MGSVFAFWGDGFEMVLEITVLDKDKKLVNFNKDIHYFFVRIEIIHPLSLYIIPSHWM